MKGKKEINTSDGISQRLIQYGRMVSMTVNKNSYVTKNITFAKNYSSTPSVQVGFNSGSTNGNFGECSVSVSNVTTTGFTLRVNCGNTGTGFSPSVDWIAIGDGA